LHNQILPAVSNFHDIIYRVKILLGFTLHFLKFYGNTTVPPPAHSGAMTTQLQLVETGTYNWKINRETKELGRQGIANARAALQNAHQLRFEDSQAA
jgi:hypothetical protein|tara:strand:+ start:13521 stop:13811 length:291 start_codon:yes stop_codon:yes gene_type:complete